MSEQLPYEEMDKQFNDLPMPDEDASWQKLKKMLDEDDEDEIIPPPVFLKSCLGWGTLLLTGLVVAWLVVRPDNWWSEAAKQKQTSSQDKNQKETIKKDSKTNTTTISEEKLNTRKTDGKTAISPKDKNTIKTNIFSSPNRNEITSLNKSTTSKETKEKISLSNADLLVKKNRQNQNQKPVPDLKTEVSSQNIPSKPSDEKVSNPKGSNQSTDTSTLNTVQQTSIVKDSSKQQSTIQPAGSTINKKTKASQKKLFLVAGIGEQQLIPIAGQTSVPYSKYGRKGSLSDYVPSVFVQLQKEKKWFVQTEFRFGAAQSVKEFSYNRQTRYDTLIQNVTTTTMRLKKTYYHQLPVSFNYYLVPNLSVGIGGMYSRFYGAITEKETNTFNVLNQTTTSFKQIIPVKHFTDSFLYKTQVHVLVQADYKWKRFSFGLRYTKDIQPYIKYTKPDGSVDEEKNQSLQFMIRYRLWQSRKF